MKITKRQIQQIIKEVINERIDVVDRDTGEVMVFGREGGDSAPEAAWPSLVKRLDLQPKDDGLDIAGDQSFSLSSQEFDRLDNEVRGKQDQRSRKRKSSQMTADRERLDIDNLLERLSNWAEDTARDYMADNPGTDLQDVAYDLADMAEHAFEADEWEELMWHFDGSLNDLKIYTAESMG
jgi:hypothetical protein